MFNRGTVATQIPEIFINRLQLFERKTGFLVDPRSGMGTKSKIAQGTEVWGIRRYHLFNFMYVFIHFYTQDAPRIIL